MELGWFAGPAEAVLQGSRSAARPRRFAERNQFGADRAGEDDFLGALAQRPGQSGLRGGEQNRQYRGAEERTGERDILQSSFSPRR